jgi:hypothetical protein
MTASTIQKYLKNKGYESISRDFLQNNDLSFEARGLLAYMESMPDNYVFYKTQLQKVSARNKRTSIDRIWNELIDGNYLISFVKRDGSKYQYRYYFTQDKFDDAAIQNIHDELAIDGFTFAPRTKYQEKKAVEIAEATISKARDTGKKWDVDFQQSKMNSPKPATNKLTSKRSTIKTIDTNRYSDDDNFSQLSTSEIFEMGEFDFLTDRSKQLLSCFGSDAKLLVNKIFESKRKVERDQQKVLKAFDKIADDPKIIGEYFAHDIEREIEKLVFKYKTGYAEGKPLNDLLGYFYVQMMRMWQLALVLQVRGQVNYAALEIDNQPKHGFIATFFSEKLSKNALKAELADVLAQFSKTQLA